MDNSSQSLSASPATNITTNPNYDKENQSSITRLNATDNDQQATQDGDQDKGQETVTMIKPVDEVVGTWTPSHSKIFIICCLVYILLILIVILSLFKSLFKGKQ